MCIRLCILFCILLYSGYCGSLNRCTNNDDCKSKQRSIERCSICAETFYPNLEGVCLFPFPYMFQTDDLACSKLSSCPVPCPVGRSFCDRGRSVYAPYCDCHNRGSILKYFGQYCEHPTEYLFMAKNYVRWLFKGFINVTDSIALQFEFKSDLNRTYKDTQLTISTSDGYFIKRSGFIDVPGNCYIREKMCTALQVPIKFPYKTFRHPSKIHRFIYLKDELLGYYDSFIFKVFDLGKIIYSRQFRIVVSYEEKDLRCIASIELRNCAPSHESPTIFNRLTVIDFESQISYVTDGRYISTSVANKSCSDNNIFTWKLWHFTGDEEMRPPLFDNYITQAWRFDPYSLDIGVYKVFFKVQHVESLTSNFAYCYIEVKALPLIIQVKGGSDRLIDKKSGLTLSAARSSDPNMPPSKQHDLRVQWSCERISPPTDFDPMCKSETMQAATPYIISPDLLTYSAVYNFTVKLWSNLYTDCDHRDVKPKIAFIRIRVGNENSGESISILCVENCNDKVIPNESLFLKVKSDNMDAVVITEFVWTYSNASVGEESLNTMKVEGMPSFMLLLREGSLESGAEYTVTVTGRLQGVYAKYSFVTDVLLYDELCKIEPLNGTRGFTEFDIICPVIDDYTLIFEFYDKSNEDMTSNTTFNGRMLGTTSTGKLLNVRLTRGHVIIRIINSQGVFKEQEIIVRLSDWNVTNDIRTELKENLTDNLIYFGDELRAIWLSSLITDMFPPKQEKDFKFLLGNLSKVSIHTFAVIKMITLTLHMIISDFYTITKGTNIIQIQTDFLVTVLDFIYRLTDQYRQFVFNRQSSQYTLSKEIKDIAQILLDCFSVQIKFKDSKLVDVQHDKLTLSDRSMLKYASYINKQIINNLKDVLTLIQYPGKPPLHISSQYGDMMISVMTNDRHYPISSYLNGSDEIPVSIPDRLMNSLTKKTFKLVDLSLQTAYIADSHFLWFKSDIKSSLVSVSLATRNSEKYLKYIRFLQHPLTIHMTVNDNVKNIRLEGCITQADPSLHQDYLDMQVRIHRLDISPRSQITISFLYPPTNGSLRVSVMEEFRPDFDHMIKHSNTISRESYEYAHHYPEYDGPRFLYIGIIPGKEVSVNQSVHYIFEVITTICQYHSINSWKSNGCSVGQVSKNNNVNCQCKHLSIFGIAIIESHQQVDPFGDAKLFLTVLDNPILVALVGAFFIFYVLLCICLWQIDKKDEIRKNVIVLEDNFPFDEFPYLLAVFTSPRLNAGTTANVGVKLFGSEADSRAHILTSNNRNVLKAGSDDWFLIKCPDYLGKIEHLHLWHDNTGWSPGWFCDNIFVYDLTTQTETKFVVEQWLALCCMEKKKFVCYPEAMLLPSEVEDISSVKTKFLDNVVLGIRDRHSVMCVPYRHPRHQVTRVQRLSIVMLYIMVAMLCSILFYKPEGENTEGVDDYHFSFGEREFIISIQCVILSTILTYIVLLSFKRSYTFKRNFRIRSTLSRRFDKEKDTLCSYFIRYIISVIKNPPLCPVQLPNTPKILGLRMTWYVFAWVSCITIMLCSAYLVILYGLKLGPVKCKKFLSTVLAAVVQDALVKEPAKIVLYAVLLSFTFQLMLDVNTYHISINDLLFQKILSKNTDVDKIFMKRGHRMYEPLSIGNRERILQEQKIRSEWWKVIAFVFAIAFVLVTCNVIFMLWSSHYHTNNHIGNMITKSNYALLHSISFCNISNVTALETYLENTFVNTIYNSRWYNRRQIIESSFVTHEHWTSDFTNILVGRPKIRQLRTDTLSCNNTVIQNVMCIQEWSKSSEDTNIYSPGWRPGSYFDIHKNDSIWVYKEQSCLFKPTLGRFYGSSGRLFHDGGYSATLGPTRLEAEQQLDEMTAYRWQDKRTRVVFVELTTFNGNKILFSQTTLIVEYLVSGTVLLHAWVSSVSSIFDVNLWNFLFVLFVVAYILRTIYLISYFGLLEFLMHFIDNLFPIINVVIGTTSIMLFCAHFYSASQYTSQLNSSAFDEHFEYDSFVRYFVLLQIALSFLVCVSIIWVIVSFLGKSMMSYFYTLTSSIISIYWLTVLCFLAFFVFVRWSDLLDITSFSLKEMIVNRKSLNNSIMCQHIENIFVKTLIFFQMFTIYVINIIFLAILIHNTRMSKSYVFNVSERFHYITFIVSRVVSWRRKYY